MRIRAKPTKYCGVRFRSKTEAKYTALFNLFDEAWTYESKRFALASGSYLPDFFLPRLQIWVEIKGPLPTREEGILCEELAFATQQNVVIAHGWPPATSFKKNGGLRLFANGYWSDKFWAFESQTQKLKICGPFNHAGCVAITEDIFHGIEDKFKKRIRTSPSKKR